MQTVAIIDYGMSNLRSVARALDFVAAGANRVAISADPDVIARADRVVFPGQGAIGQCMSNLRSHGLLEVLQQCLRQKPFLGICLGLQSLMEWSAEDGGTACLAFLPGKVVRFADGLTDAASGQRLKIPHMGWNHVVPSQPHPLWDRIEPGEMFYFVHSYHVVAAREEDVAARTEYGANFVSACCRGNVFATQFHPEKSQRAGLTLLANFLAWTGD